MKRRSVSFIKPRHFNIPSYTPNEDNYQWMISNIGKNTLFILDEITTENKMFESFRPKPLLDSEEFVIEDGGSHSHSLSHNNINMNK